MMRLLHRRHEGYTLIELFVVIAVIAILVGIVSVNFAGIMDRIGALAIAAGLLTV